VADDRATTLRRRIALLRRYLQEGVEVELAAEYINQIKQDEQELKEIGRNQNK